MSLREPTTPHPVLAFDPGLSITGYAVLRIQSNTPPALAEAGTIDLAHTAPRPAASIQPATEAERWAPRLVELAADADRLIHAHRPAHAAIEAVFAHREHPRAAIAMAHARGVILQRLAAHDIPVFELSPATIKKAITGNGRASKDQLARAVALRLNLTAPPEPRDVSDAIAIALAASDRIHAKPLTRNAPPAAPAEP